jgi:hypothetical protein
VPTAFDREKGAHREVSYHKTKPFRLAERLLEKETLSLPEIV